MPTIFVLTRINAPIEICFDLARSVELHIRSTEGTNEKAVDGVTSGLLDLGQEVTWEATHLKVRQRLTSRIMLFDRPNYFRDSQIRGPFRRFDHDHVFVVESGATIMREVFDYTSPFGWLGRCVDRMFLQKYMTELLENRAITIKAAAEAAAR